MNRNGFSLVELMIVVGLIALVASFAVVGVLRHRENAEDIRMQSELTSIYKGMEAFRQGYGRYPRTNAELRPYVSVPDFDAKYEINQSP